jgi:N-acetyl-anhydromuramyl-L-alanine amidase AmpD
MLTVKRLIIHHSLTKDGAVNDWDAIRRYHIETNGWRDIGYHYGIENVGGKIVLQKGRRESQPGAHTKGMNEKSLGICVVGNYDLAEPSEAAMNVLANLCASLCKKYRLTENDIRTHHEYASYKTCPGSKFPMDKLREKVRAIMAGGHG